MSVPGFALASASSSWMFCAGSFGVARITIGELPIMHDRREILDRVVGRLGLQRGGGRMRGRVGEPHGVAVGLGAGDRLAAERGAGADAVVDHDLLAEPLGQPLADDAGDDVGAAAGLERHDQADRPFARPFVRGRLRRQRRWPRAIPQEEQTQTGS